MNAKKEVFHKGNKEDYSLRQGAIKSAEDSGLKGKTVEECCFEYDQYNDTYCEEEYRYCIKKEYDPITNTTTFKKVIR